MVLYFERWPLGGNVGCTAVLFILIVVSLLTEEELIEREKMIFGLVVLCNCFSIFYRFYGSILVLSQNLMFFTPLFH